MARMNKISPALSVAATVLLEACSSSGSDASGPTPVANTTAPELLATWETGCTVTDNSGPTTTTFASGGSGGGSISDGEAYINRAVFNQDGRVEFTTEYYWTADCNPNKMRAYSYSAVYYVGGATLANDGSPVTEVDFADASATTYSIFQVVSDSELYLGEATASSADNDGSSGAARLDGLGPRLLKR